MEPPEILINGRFSLARLTGVQRYATEVSRRLEKRSRLLIPKGASGGFSGHLWEQVILPTRVGKDDLLWSPANSGPLALENQVVVLHDLSPIDHPEWFNRRYAAWYRFLLPRLARRVRRVITVSEFSKQRLMQTFRMAEEKVAVIPGGVSADFAPATGEEIARWQARRSLSKPYLLAVGSLQPRKNLACLFQAWREVHARFLDLELVLAGAYGHAFRNPLLGEAPEGVRMLGYLEDSELPALYSGAQALVFPSCYEGFGLPVLEAMACGTPVIAANTTALPEVAGGAAILVDPENPLEIAEAVLSVVKDQSLRQELSQKGLQHARGFSWDTTAQQVWEVLCQSLAAR